MRRPGHVEAAEKAQLNISDIRSIYSRIYEIPFTSKNKKMIVAVRDPFDDNKVMLFAKGAPEVIEGMLVDDGHRISELAQEYAERSIYG